MSNNFVSISAVSNQEQLTKISQICREEWFMYPLVIGYQVSNKSINMGTQNPRQPSFSELGALDKSTRDYGFTTAIHYHTKNNETIVEDLEKIAEIGVDPSGALVQLNTLPATPETLKKVKDMGYKIIFPVAVSDKQTPDGGFAVWKGNGVEDVASGNVSSLVNQVVDRKDYIDYVMFDPSHGTNLKLNLNSGSLAIRFGNEIVNRKDLDHLGLVYAGGVNPDNVYGLTHVLESRYPKRISIDTESGVRIDNKLGLDLVRNHLVNYREGFER